VNRLAVKMVIQSVHVDDTPIISVVPVYESIKALRAKVEIILTMCYIAMRKLLICFAVHKFISFSPGQME
jgi:hypothetical protein